MAGHLPIANATAVWAGRLRERLSPPVSMSDARCLPSESPPSKLQRQLAGMRVFQRWQRLGGIGRSCESAGVASLKCLDRLLTRAAPNQSCDRQGVAMALWATHRADELWKRETREYHAQIVALRWQPTVLSALLATPTRNRNRRASSKWLAGRPRWLSDNSRKRSPANSPPSPVGFVR